MTRVILGKARERKTKGFFFVVLQVMPSMGDAALNNSVFTLGTVTAIYARRRVHDFPDVILTFLKILRQYDNSDE